VVFEQPAPAPDLLRALWQLLPYSTRAERWPATFAFGNALGFDAVVLPRLPADQCAGYLTGDQAGDYPEGSYEYSLQRAAEAGDQRDLDDLFARRSSNQTLKLAVTILVATMLLAVAMKILNLAVEPPPPTVTATVKATTPTGPMLAAAYAPLTAEARQRLGAALAELTGAGPATVEEQLTALEQRLPAGGEPHQRWQQARPSPDPERRLRVLLWAYGVPNYADERLNPVELVELLRPRLRKDQP